MSDPVYPHDECIRVLQSTVATILRDRPSPQQLCDDIVRGLYGIQNAADLGDFGLCAAHAGTIASMALVLQLDAMSRMPPKAQG